MAQFGRPDSDVSTGSWTTTPLWSKLDEVTASDADLVTSSNNPTGGDTFEVGLTTVTDPVSSSSHTYRVRHVMRYSGGGGPSTLDVTYALFQGTTQIATGTHSYAKNAQGVWTDSAVTLSAGEADSITDYSDLRIRVTATDNNDGSRTVYAEVSWAELEVPDASTDTPVEPTALGLNHAGQVPTVVVSDNAQVSPPTAASTRGLENETSVSFTGTPPASSQWEAAFDNGTLAGPIYDPDEGTSGEYYLASFDPSTEHFLIWKSDNWNGPYAYEAFSDPNTSNGIGHATVFAVRRTDLSLTPYFGFLWTEPDGAGNVAVYYRTWRADAGGVWGTERNFYTATNTDSHAVFGVPSDDTVHLIHPWSAENVSGTDYRRPGYSWHLANSANGAPTTVSSLITGSPAGHRSATFGLSDQQSNSTLIVGLEDGAGNDDAIRIDAGSVGTAESGDFPVGTGGLLALPSDTTGDAQWLSAAGDRLSVDGDATVGTAIVVTTEDAGLTDFAVEADGHGVRGNAYQFSNGDVLVFYKADGSTSVRFNRVLGGGVRVEAEIATAGATSLSLSQGAYIIPIPDAGGPGGGDRVVLVFIDSDDSVTMWEYTGSAGLHFDGLVPTILTPVAVQVPTNTLDHQGVAPGVVDSGAGGVLVEPGLLGINHQGFAPTVLTPVAVQPGVNSIDHQGLAPTLVTPVAIQPGVAAFNHQGFAPTVLTPVAIQPGVNSVDHQGFAPTVLTPVAVQPEVGTLDHQGLAPEVLTPVAVQPGVASVDHQGFAPTILTPVVIQPGLGTLDHQGVVPTLVTPVAVQPPAGTLDHAGVIPTVVALDAQVVSPPTATLDHAGLAPTALAPSAILPDVLAIDHAGVIPAVIAGANVAVAVPTATLDWVGQVPAVLAPSVIAVPAQAFVHGGALAPSVIADTAVAPTANGLTFSGVAPAVLAPSVIKPDVLALDHAGVVPSVDVAENVAVEPGVGTLNHQGLAPAILAPVAVQPGVGVLDHQGLIPAVLAPVAVQPGVSAFDHEGVTPTILTPVAVQPGLGTLDHQGVTPTLVTPVVIQPPVGTLDHAGVTPAVATSDAKVVSAPAATFDHSGLTPTVLAPSAILPDVLSIDHAGVAPTVVAGANVDISVPALSLAFSGEVAVVLAPSAIQPDVLALDHAGVVPAVIAGEFVDVDVPSASLSLSGQAPEVLAPSAIKPDVLAIDHSGVTPNVVADTGIRPGVLALDWAGVAPTIDLPVVVAPGTLGIDHQASEPTISVGDAVDLQIPTATLDLAGVAPAVLAPSVIKPGVLGLDHSGATASVVSGTLIKPGVLAIDHAGLAGGVVADTAVLPPAATLDHSGLTPDVLTPVVITPGVRPFDHQGQVPVIEADANVVVQPDALSLDHAGLAPTIGLDVSVGVPLAARGWGSEAPSVLTPVAVAPGVLAVDHQGAAPTVDLTEDAYVQPDVATLDHSGVAPTVLAGADVVLEPALGTLDHSGLAPVVEASANVTVAPPSRLLGHSGLVVAAVVTADVFLGPDTLALSVGTLTPGVVQNHLVQPPLKTLSLSGVTPDVAVLVGTVILVGTNSLTWSAPAPSLGLPSTLLRPAVTDLTTVFVVELLVDVFSLSDLTVSFGGADLGSGSFVVDLSSADAPTDLGGMEDC